MQQQPRKPQVDTRQPEEQLPSASHFAFDIPNDAVHEAVCDAAAQACAMRWEQRMGNNVESHMLERHFWGGRLHVSHFVDALAASFPAYRTFIDIGAGSYGGADESLALHFHRSWSRPDHRTHVMAFEPSHTNPVHTLAARTAGEVRTWTDMVADRSGSLPFFAYPPSERSKATIATANLRIVSHPVYRGALRRSVPAVSVDALLERENVSTVDILKTDAEGCDWEVLRGAGQLLAQQRVRVIIAAYEDKWSLSTLRATDKVNPVVAETVAAMELPTLRSVTQQLARVGYTSFLLGADDESRLLDFVPLSGTCWRDAFELGHDPASLGLRATWFDFVAVVTGSPEHEWIQTHVASCASPQAARAPTSRVGKSVHDHDELRGHGAVPAGRARDHHRLREPVGRRPSTEGRRPSTERCDTPARIVDIVPFNDELDMLDYRLKLHSPFVSVFVILESGRTYAGTPKPLFAHDLLLPRAVNCSGPVMDMWQETEPAAVVTECLVPIAPATLTRVRLVNLSLPEKDPPGRASWGRELVVRHFITHHVAHRLPAGELAAVSDVDELFDAAALPAALQLLAQRPCVQPRLRHFWYSTRCIKLRNGQPSTGWVSSVIIRTGTQWLHSAARSSKVLRYLTDADGCVAPATYTGWHFSYFMDTRRILHKLRVFAHSSDAATQAFLSKPGSLETKICEHASSCTHLFVEQGLQLSAQPFDGKLPDLPGWPQHESPAGEHVEIDGSWCQHHHQQQQQYSMSRTWRAAAHRWIGG